MAIRTYHDFILQADRAERSQDDAVVRFQTRVFDSPVGQGEQEEAVRVPGELADQLHLLERGHLDTDLEGQIALGEMLAGLLLPPYAREMFRASLSRLSADEGLRLRLRVGNALADLPWEYAYIDDRASKASGPKSSSGFLALDPRIAIAWHEAVHVPGDWFTPRQRRRIVVAMASPEGEQALPHLLVGLRRFRRSLTSHSDRIWEIGRPERRRKYSGSRVVSIFVTSLAQTWMVRAIQKRLSPNPAGVPFTLSGAV